MHAQNRLEHAFVQCLSALATRRPLLLVLDDLHWGDATAMSLLDALFQLPGELEPSVVESAGRLERRGIVSIVDPSSDAFRFGRRSRARRVPRPRRGHLHGSRRATGRARACHRVRPPRDPRPGSRCQADRYAKAPFAIGGGGSGGAILLETAALTIEGGAVVVANGGGGGSGNLADHNGAPGGDGTRSTMQAPGGIAGYATAGNGGLGGSSSAPPTPGGFSGHSMSGGGGGGGAEGRIRVNVIRSGTSLSGLTVSPAPSIGAARAD